MTGRELMNWIEDNGAMDNDIVVFNDVGLLTEAADVSLAPVPETGELKIVIL